MTSLLNIKLLPFVLLAVTIPSTCPDKGWRGIVPLRSTRIDVERLLGVPDDKTTATYHLNDATVVFYYSHSRCDDEGWNISPNTVISIAVYPKVRVKLADLKYDLSGYKKEHGDPDVWDHFYYRNEDCGLVISVRGEVVDAYIYRPIKKDNDSFRCQRDLKRG